ncbi:MAG: hypothetical protein KJ569_06365 [Candidatus Omnitrophica bacterium]|nr:hypothetical protein [Candidatus Omnitrophota bacterium]MBU1134517.1 hypothetical protein [Candidatus Omnitrophota bacterium]MBU1810828.1 hypothetical protein [Candidatus Omnitrophota bacterium]
MRKIILGIFAILLFTSLCYADSEVYEFTKTYRIGLQHLVINAEKAQQNLENINQDDTEAMTIALLSQTRQGISRLKQARALFEKYLNSKNGLVKETTKATIFTYDAKIKIANENLKLYEDMITNPQELTDGRFIIETARLDAESEKMWGMLMHCSILLTYCMVDQKPDKDGTLQYLVLTTAERNELIKELDDLYDGSIKNGLQAGMSKLQGCGAVIREFLAGEHKSSDER